MIFNRSMLWVWMKSKWEWGEKPRIEWPLWHNWQMKILKLNSWKSTLKLNWEKYKLRMLKQNKTSRKEAQPCKLGMTSAKIMCYLIVTSQKSINRLSWVRKMTTSLVWWSINSSAGTSLLHTMLDREIKRKSMFKI